METVRLYCSSLSPPPVGATCSHPLSRRGGVCLESVPTAPFCQTLVEGRWTTTHWIIFIYFFTAIHGIWKILTEWYHQKRKIRERCRSSLAFFDGTAGHFWRRGPCSCNLTSLLQRLLICSLRQKSYLGWVDTSLLDKMGCACGCSQCHTLPCRRARDCRVFRMALFFWRFNAVRWYMTL